MVLAEFFIPHGHCYLWKPELVGLHIISDALTALAYYSIPLMLVYFVSKRRDVPFNWIFLLFGAFIVSCGTTHIMEIWTLWHPNYWLSGSLKAFTAAVSLYTAWELISLLPQALAMPSAAQFEAVKTEIKERQRTQAALLREKTNLSLAQKIAHVGSWEFDFATQEITWSDETFRIYGLAPRQPMPTLTEHRQKVHPEDRRVLNQTINQLARGKSCELEFRIVRPDGSIRHVFAQGEPIFNVEGRVYKLFGTLLDISDRVAAQERERLVGAISLRIHQSLELQEILNTTVTEVRQFLQTDRVLIYRFNPDWSGLVAVESVGANWTAVMGSTLHDPCFGKDYSLLYQQGRVGAIANIHSAGLMPCFMEFLAQFQVTASLTVPILLGEKVWGLLIVHHCRSERHWQSYEIELLQQLATQVAIAIQQSELYSRVQAELIERQRTEQELRESEERFRQLAEHIHQVFWMVCADEHRQFLYVSPVYEKIWRRSCQSLYEQPIAWFDAIHSEDRERIVAALQKIPGRNYNEEYRIVRPDGSIRWIGSRAFPIKNELGEVYRIAGISEDITERKQTEAALRDLTQQEREKAEQLEQALKELQRTQAHLVQNEKMVSLGQLVAGVAHEINNPTSFIYGNIFLAREYAQELLHLLQFYQQQYPELVPEIVEPQKRFDLDFIAQDFPKLLASMEEGANRINEIVKSLRNFSRLDERECKQVDIHEGIDNTLLILRHRLIQQPKRSEIQVLKDYGELPLVECYPGQLNQVFMNIISNAIDALEGLKVDKLKVESWADNLQPSNLQLSTLCIRIHTEVVEPNWVVIRIADNGPGITAEAQSRIFDPFFTTKPPGKGTGLGLSISYQIVVDKHRGQLTFHSVPDLGVEFVIKLPISDRALAEAIAYSKTLTGSQKVGPKPTSF